MRSFICQLLAVAVLFMGAEGAWDLVTDSHLQGQELISQVDLDDHVPTGSDPLSDGDGFQCGHLCHGHASSISSGPTVVLAVVSNHYRVLDTAAFPSHSQAPPTPPPNV